MNNVIRDVYYRTNGEMYIGVVGSVRSGKSMFIRKFIQTKVLPFVQDEEVKNKIIDELPQSAEGKAIMTVEPKFVPTTPVQITVEDDLKLNVRLVDCVGYILENAKGYENEDGSPRLVRTPWFSENIAFEDAATIGTQKVINNHSHIGILMTSDGSFGEFTRHDFESVEEKLVDELKSLDKPFVIVLNTAEPNSNKTLKLIESLATKYGVSVIPVNVMDLTDRDIDVILREALNEFDISKLEIKIPTWVSALDDCYEKKQIFNEVVNQTTGEYRKFKDVQNIKDNLSECDLFSKVEISNLDSGTGEVEITIDFKDELFDEIVTDILGKSIEDRGEYITLLQDFVRAKKEYDKLSTAIEAVKATGYGIANPDVNDLELDKPEVVKHGSRYGIKLRAKAPSIHLIKVDVESTFEPIIGSEEQSKQLLNKIMDDYDTDPNAMWESEIFGRKLSEVVNDGIKAKLYLIPENVQYKLRQCLEKIVNKGRGNIIAIIL
ncbi:MAG TPA: stage IV sporulation protein A [Acholeplasmataceae bacterium]|nr:stage IV sporulation protein A [Acholeplasmataceae bacterium]